MDKYEFGEAAKALYGFVWDDFASWYVEISKVDLASDDEENKLMTKNVLVYVLKSIVKLLHPFIPFITEEIYQALPHEEKSITISSWPKVLPQFNDDNVIESFEDMKEIITSIRNERAKANKSPKEPLCISILAKDFKTKEMIEATTNYLTKFTNPKKLEFLDKALEPKGNVVVVLSMATIYIPSSDLVDQNEVIKKLNDKKAKLEAELLRSKQML